MRVLVDFAARASARPVGGFCFFSATRVAGRSSDRLRRRSLPPSLGRLRAPRLAHRAFRLGVGMMYPLFSSSPLAHTMGHSPSIPEGLEVLPVVTATDIAGVPAWWVFRHGMAPLFVVVWLPTVFLGDRVRACAKGLTLSRNRRAASAGPLCSWNRSRALQLSSRRLASPIER